MRWLILPLPAVAAFAIISIRFKLKWRREAIRREAVRDIYSSEYNEGDITYAKVYKFPNGRRSSNH